MITIGVVLLWLLGIRSVFAEVVLTTDEQDYLAQKQQINLCTDPDWLPYEGIDEKGRFTGIMSDFYALWSEKIATPIVLTPTVDWRQSLQFVQQGKCDILSSAHDVASRRSWLSVTTPFIFYPLAVATQPDHEFIVKFEQVSDRDFVMVEDYAAVELLRNHYPDIQITLVKTPSQGLKLVESGNAYGYIDTVPTINYQMLRWGISHLKISGVLDLQYAMSVGVSTRQPELLGIFNKIISDTAEQERQAVLKNWLSIDYQAPRDNVLFWQWLSASVLILIVLIYRYWRVRKHNRNLRHLNRHLEKLSLHDHLTGLANRYALNQRFNAETRVSNQTRQVFSLILLDIDYFKHINDCYGHAVGDRLIKEFAVLLQTLVRDSDMVGRWGGEEFLILCSQTGKRGAYQLAEQIRLRLQQHAFSVETQITASFGVSQYQDGEAITETIKRADDALYHAKENGRDQVVMVDG